MKLEFDDIQDFYRLTELVAAGRKALAEARDNPTTNVAVKVANTIALAMKISPEAARAAGLAEDPDSQPDGTKVGLPAADSDGAPHNTDWHSEPAKINADGTWRARRKRDEAAYKDWLLSLAVEEAEAAIAAEAGEEPVATETHALPQNSEDPDQVDTVPRSGVVEQADTAPTVDLAALIAGSQEAAENAPDGTIDLLNRGKDFIKEYGTARFEALKAAVAPLEDGTGKPVPSLTPTERRLLRACMDNYPLYV